MEKRKWSIPEFEILSVSEKTENGTVGPTDGMLGSS